MHPTTRRPRSASRLLTRGALLIALALAGCAEEPVVDAPEPTPEQDARVVEPDASPAATEPPPVEETAVPDEPGSDDAAREAERLRTLVSEYERLRAEGEAQRDAYEEARERLIAAGPAMLPYLFELPSDSSAWNGVFGWGGILLEVCREPPFELICDRLRREGGAEGQYFEAAMSYLEGHVESAWVHQPRADVVLDTLAALLDPESSLTEQEQHVAYYALVQHGRRNPELVAERMGTFLLHLADEGSDEAMFAAYGLAFWGPDTALVLPVILPRLDEFELEEQVYALAAASAGTVPDMLPIVIAGLESEGEDADARQTRIAAAESLRTWDAAAEPARAALEAMFASEDEHERVAAAVALAGLADPSAEVRRVVLRDSDDLLHLLPAQVLGRDMLRRGEHYVGLIGGPDEEDWYRPWIDGLLELRPDLATAIAERYEEGPVHWIRESAAELFTPESYRDDDPFDRLPEGYQSYLRRALASGPVDVRAAIAMRFSKDSTLGEAARAVITKLATCEDEEVRARIDRFLDPEQRRSPHDPEPIDDADVLGELAKRAARRGLDHELLARADRLLRDVPRLSQPLALALVQSHSRAARDFLLRSEGHREVVAEGLKWLLAHPKPDRIDWGDVERAVVFLGEDATLHRGRVERVLAKLEAHSREAATRRMELAFAGAAGDTLRYALEGSPWDADVRRRLVELEAFDELVLHLGRRGDDSLSWVPDDEPELHWAVRRAVEVAADDPHHELRLRGAARLLGHIPPDQALSALRVLLNEPSADVRGEALETYARTTIEAEGQLTDDVVEWMFEDRLGGFPFLLYASHTLDDRRRVVTQGLYRLLRIGIEAERLVAARLLVQRGEEAAEPARVARDVLRARRGRPSVVPGVDPKDLPPTDAAGYVDDRESPPWASEWSHEVALVLKAVDPEPDDVELILGVMPPGEPRVLLPLLERMGPAAVAALPTLRRWVAPTPYELEGHEGRTRADATVRVLRAIGPAARSALPELRFWLQQTRDPAPVVRAIAAIEGN